ncbi:MAG: hypothetical protein MJ232_03110 [archaeon]|nr:hypothetical protein [archaeon]
MNFNKRNTTIEIIGSPGSGKTTLVAFLSKHFIAQGYKVFTDVDILGTYPFEWINHYGLYNMENSIIIQDEAGTVEGLQNRDYKSNFKGDEGQSRLNMLKRHRHYKQDLFFLSQGEDFEKRVKDLCTEYWVLKHTNINWLLIIDIYRSEIEVDEMTQDFRLAKKKIKRRFLFSPVVWLSFDTFECVKLPDLNNNPRGIK